MPSNTRATAKQPATDVDIDDNLSGDDSDQEVTIQPRRGRHHTSAQDNLTPDANALPTGSTPDQSAADALDNYPVLGL